ncbi:hypothetical protein HPB48_002394 [Haemaphysalis longicornis]|uniref:Granulins domain-containing protein n=1 Tax=Haemaphysalis longicornis TaxID=44386 RepID=A0A9J6GAV6_HAELO|nr:hypothetical protein HPB48_002394 [Haemaphysalis longicornis]
MPYLSISLRLDAESTARIECPDGSFCQQGSTCCPSSPASRMNGGPAYSCCPHEDAQCCGDREHCCPSGTRCLRSRGGYRCLIASAGAGGHCLLRGSTPPSTTRGCE